MKTRSIKLFIINKFSIFVIDFMVITFNVSLMQYSINNSNDGTAKIYDFFEWFEYGHYFKTIKYISDKRQFDLIMLLRDYDWI